MGAVSLSLHSLQVQKDLSPVVPQCSEVWVRSQELLRELECFFIQFAITPLYKGQNIIHITQIRTNYKRMYQGIFML